MSDVLFALTLVAALGCGLIAGVFFAFSTFVMKGLGNLPPARGAAAMQAINVTAVSFAFMTALFGTGLACAVVGVWGLAEWSEPYGPYLVADGALYLVGVIVLTIAFHVPRNNALAAVEPESEEAAAVWTRYLAEWTAGNHVRTVAPLVSAAALTVALSVG